MGGHARVEGPGVVTQFAARLGARARVAGGRRAQPLGGVAGRQPAVKGAHEQARGAHQRVGKPDDARARTRHRPDAPGRRGQRVGLARDDVVFPRPAPLHRQQVSGGDVVHVGPAVHGAGRQHARPPLQQIAQQLGHRAVIAGAVDQPGQHRDQGKSGLGHSAGHLVVGDPLRAVVLAGPAPLPAVVEVRFVHHAAAGVAVDREGGGVDGAGYAQLERGGQHRARALHVDALAQRRPHADGVPAGDVEDAVHPFHRGSQPGAVVEVAAEHRCTGLFQRTRLCGGARQHPHAVAALEQEPGEPAANEAGGPGDQVVHGSVWHTRGCGGAHGVTLSAQGASGASSSGFSPPALASLQTSRKRALKSPWSF